jgi:radical SAM protein with 4Fe4S-binding SPASM domain
MNLEISTNVGCSMKCSYCPQPIHVKNYKKTGGGQMMDYQDFCRYLDKVPPEVDILFAGMAEPFLNKDAWLMVGRANGNGHRVGVYTTTVGLMPLAVEFMKDINYLHFCIHLPDDKGAMTLNVTDEYLYGLKWAMKIPHTFTCIGNIHPKVKEITGEIPDSTTSLISRAGQVKGITPPYKEGNIQCSASPNLDHHVLMPNGDIQLCCMDYSLQNTIGNLGTMTWDELHQSENYLKIKNGMKNGENIICRNCEIAETI